MHPDELELHFVRHHDGSLSPRPEAKLSVAIGCLRVDGIPFLVEEPDGVLHAIKDGELVTMHEGRRQSWAPHQIVGGFP